MVVEMKRGAVSRAPVSDTFWCSEFSRSGARLYSVGAADKIIRVFDFTEGKLQANQCFALRDARQRGIRGSLADLGKSIQARADGVKGSAELAARPLGTRPPSRLLLKRATSSVSQDSAGRNRDVETRILSL